MRHDSTVSANHILARLRDEVGDSEFGYRLQALFAHVLGRLGASILEVNAQGHPDIRGVSGVNWRPYRAISVAA